MPRTVTYQIHDRADGRFGVAIALGPDKTYRREDFATLAEAEEWIEGLRVLMAACGAPLVRDPTGPDAGPPVPADKATCPCEAGGRQRPSRDGTGAQGSDFPPQQSFIK